MVKEPLMGHAFLECIFSLVIFNINKKKKKLALNIFQTGIGQAYDKFTYSITYETLYIGSIKENLPSFHK